MSVPCCAGSAAAALVLLGVTLAACTPDQAQRPGSRDNESPQTSQPDVLVIAHKGASAYAPQNTLTAAREAVSRGADAVEADIRQTSDGHPVALFHGTLAPTTDVEEVFPDRRPWAVESFTLDEIRRLDAGSWFAPGFAGEMVPTLTELANTVENCGIELIVEVKSPERYPGIGRRVLRQIRSRPGVFREVESFDLGFLRRFARLSPPVTLGAAKGASMRQMKELSPFVDSLNAPLNRVDRVYVRRAHQLGFEVKVWSLKSAAEVRTATDLGVDGIYSPRPDLVRDVLGR